MYFMIIMARKGESRTNTVYLSTVKPKL